MHKQSIYWSKHCVAPCLLSWRTPLACQASKYALLHEQGAQYHEQMKRLLIVTFDHTFWSRRPAPMRPRQQRRPPARARKPLRQRRPRAPRSAGAWRTQPRLRRRLRGQRWLQRRMPHGVPSWRPPRRPPPQQSAGPYLPLHCRCQFNVAFAPAVRVASLLLSQLKRTGHCPLVCM